MLDLQPSRRRDHQRPARRGPFRPLGRRRARPVRGRGAAARGESPSRVGRPAPRPGCAEPTRQAGDPLDELVGCPAHPGARRQPRHRPPVPARARRPGRRPPRGATRPATSPPSRSGSRSGPGCWSPWSRSRTPCGPSSLPSEDRLMPASRPPPTPSAGPRSDRQPRPAAAHGARAHRRRAGCPRRPPGRRLRHLRPHRASALQVDHDHRHCPGRDGLPAVRPGRPLRPLQHAPSASSATALIPQLIRYLSR